MAKNNKSNQAKRKEKQDNKNESKNEEQSVLENDEQSVLEIYKNDGDCAFVLNKNCDEIGKIVEKVKMEVEKLFQKGAILESNIEYLSNLKEFIDHFQKALIKKENNAKSQEKQELLDFIVDLSFLENLVLSYIVQYNTANYNKSLPDLTKQFENKFSETERTMTNHAMTFISVLAAIIAIVTSVITTSSTWLNNANKKDAILAFTLPSLVILVAVTLLLTFCGFMYPGGKKRQIASIVIFVCVAVLIVVFAFVVLPPIMNGI